jgi:putative ABC transport system ATP-binding protein
MALLDLRDVEKVFYRGDEKITAVRSMNLQIQAGEYVVITGASGSGKSTLLYMMGLLDVPSAGEYLVQESSTSTLSDAERARLRNVYMGFVFQSFHLIPRATALKNVMMPLLYAASHDGIIDVQTQEQMARQVLQRVGLADRMEHIPNQLSGGQRQRVAIARAIVNKPRVIFADEPTGNLDSKSGNEIIGLFESLHSEGVTIIIVTHDPRIAERAPRKLVLEDGALVGDSYAG